MTDYNKQKDQHELVQAQIAKLKAETKKIQRESLYHPMVVASTLTIAVTALFKLFFS